MRCPKSERNFNAFTSSSAAEQKAFTRAVKRLVSVAGVLAFGDLQIPLLREGSV